MNESKRRVVQFLEKEIKTYAALGLYLSKDGRKNRLPVRNKEPLLSPTFYKERMKEAKRLVNELRKPK